MKKYIFFLIIAVIAPIILKAQVSLSQFEIAANYLSSSKLLVSNPAIATDFKFYISLQRAAASTGGYVAGNCTVTLLYTENPNNFTEATASANYENDPSTIELMTPKNVTSSDYSYATANFDALKPISAKLPANKTTGRIIFRYKYYSTISNKDVTYYASTKYNIVLPTQPTVIEPAIISKIQSMGFSTENIEYRANEFGTYYVVEQDVMIAKGPLSQINSNNYLITDLKKHNVNILVTQSLWTGANEFNTTYLKWINEIQWVVSQWNSYSNSNVKLNLIYEYQTDSAPIPEIDIVIKSDGGRLAADKPILAEYAHGNGSTGKLILVNPDFSFQNYTTTFIGRAIGHCLGLKHIDINDANVSTNYPIDIDSEIIPFISSRTNNLHASESLDFRVSYLQFGLNYSWKVIGINGTNYLNDIGNNGMTAILPEESFPAGNFQIQCTISGGKYTTPVTVSKNIVTQ